MNPKLAAALKDQEAYAFTDYSRGVIRIFFDTEIFNNKTRAFDALTHEFYNAAEIKLQPASYLIQRTTSNVTM